MRIEFVQKLIDKIRGKKHVNQTKNQKEIFEYLLPYGKYATNKQIFEPSDKYENCIWQLWLQGEENAPDIVKLCLNSVRKYSGGRKVIFLDEKNLFNYFEPDSLIWQKYKDGIIPPTQFSDYVRLCLLAKYGGTWVDATILFTAPIPKEIEKQEFFAYKLPAGMYLDNIPLNITNLHRIRWGVGNPYHLVSIWFLHTKAKHIIPRVLLNMLTEALKQEKTLPDYFLAYYLFTIMLLNNKDCLDSYNKMLIQSHLAPIYMLWSYKENFTTQRWQEILSTSNIHKLTYKTDAIEAVEGSIMGYIIQESKTYTPAQERERERVVPLFEKKAA